MTPEERKQHAFDALRHEIAVLRNHDAYYEPLCVKFPCQLLLAHKTYRCSLAAHCGRAPRPTMREPGVEIPVKEEHGKYIRVGTVNIRGQRMDAKYAGPCQFFVRDENEKVEGFTENAD